MKIGVRNNRSKINPDVKVDSNETILRHNTFSDKAPDFHVEVPHMIGVAAEEDRRFTEHCEEVEKELQARFEDATPSKAEIDKIDKIASGETRDHDYTHPPVDNIYTGKFVLDESKASFITRKNVSRMLKEADEYPKTMSVAFDEDWALFDTLKIGLCTPANGYYSGGSARSCGIYPEVANAKAKEMDREAEIYVTSEEGMNEVRDTLIDLFYQYHVLDRRTDKEKAEAIRNIKFFNFHAHDNAENAGDGIENAIAQIINKDITDDSMRISRDEINDYYKEAKRNVAKDVFAKLSKKYAGRVSNMKALTVKNTDIEFDNDCFYSWLEIDGSAIASVGSKSGQMIDDKLVMTASDMWDGNPWMKKIYSADDIIVTDGEPLGLEFAQDFLDYAWGIVNSDFTPSSSMTALDVATHPFIYNVSGNKLRLYIAQGGIDNLVVSNASEEAKVKKFNEIGGATMTKDDDGKDVIADYSIEYTASRLKGQPITRVNIAKSMVAKENERDETDNKTSMMYFYAKKRLEELKRLNQLPESFDAWKAYLVTYLLAFKDSRLDIDANDTLKFAESKRSKALWDNVVLGKAIKTDDNEGLLGNVIGGISNVVNKIGL